MSEKISGAYSWIYLSSSFALQVADKRILELEATRDLSKFWMHVDMDAFYAAVETLENPSLKGKPLAVGGMSMICTASYEVWITICKIQLKFNESELKIQHSPVGLDHEFQLEELNVTLLLLSWIEWITWYFRHGSLGFVLQCQVSLLANYAQTWFLFPQTSRSTIITVS